MQEEYIRALHSRNSNAEEPEDEDDKGTKQIVEYVEAGDNEQAYNLLKQRLSKIQNSN